MVGQVADAPEKLQDHIPDVAPVGGEHRQQSAQVQQYVEKLRDVRGAGHAQQMLRDGQVAGAGNGQELRYALDEAQENG